MNFGTLLTWLKPYAASALRHGLTTGAGALAAHGIIAANQENSAVQVGSAIVLGGVTQLWSWYQKSQASKTLAAAVAAPAVKS